MKWFIYLNIYILKSFGGVLLKIDKVKISDIAKEMGYFKEKTNDDINF